MMLPRPHLIPICTVASAKSNHRHEGHTTDNHHKKFDMPLQRPFPITECDFACAGNGNFIQTRRKLDGTGFVCAAGKTS
jgi:hypothetical protein